MILRSVFIEDIYIFNMIYKHGNNIYIIFKKKFTLYF